MIEGGAVRWVALSVRAELNRHDNGHARENAVENGVRSAPMRRRRAGIRHRQERIAKPFDARFLTPTRRDQSGRGR